MSTRSVTHATFTVERHYDAAPERVYAACADPASKAAWFAETEGWVTTRYELDFRVGGREASSATPGEGQPSHDYDAIYLDIVPNERIISSYEMALDGARISVSLATMQFAPDGEGTRLTYTEQGAFLDGFDQPELREEGCRSLLDALDAELRRQTADA